MKRFLIFVAGLLLCFQTYAQSSVFSQIVYLDKFNDTIKEENVKTIIEKTDSTFVFETKGKTSVTYFIKLSELNRGDKDNVVNLTSNIYGYETSWCVIREDMYEDYLKDWLNLLHKGDFDTYGDAHFSILQKYCLIITRRVITTKYTHDYIREYIWIEDEQNTNKLGKNINRIVYCLD